MQFGHLMANTSSPESISLHAGQLVQGNFGSTTTQVEKVCNYYEATSSNQKMVPGLILSVIKAPKGFIDAVRISESWTKKTSKQEPGESMRHENMEREGLSTEVERQQMAMHVFDLMVGGLYSAEAARRKLHPQPTAEHFKTLLKEGAIINGIEHPEISVELLMKRESGLHAWWRISRKHSLKSRKAQNAVAKLYKRYPVLAEEAAVD